jgi:exodeoxyribonuclease VII small subunit
MADQPDTTPTTFREAYAVLQSCADTLRNQREPNIDDLLGIVQRSSQAYQICRDRIDAVERALAETLGAAAAT